MPAPSIGFVTIRTNPHFLSLFISNLPNESVKRVVDIVPQSCRGFVERAPELPRERLTLLHGHFPLGREVAFIAHQHQRRVLRGAHSRDQFAVLQGLLEAMSVGNGVADEEALSAAHVLIAHSCELDLASSVEDIQQCGLAIDHRLLLVRVLYNLP